MSELGDVVKYDILSDNLIVSHNLISEFIAYPSEIFNVDKAIYKNFVDSKLFKEYIDLMADESYLASYSKYDIFKIISRYYKNKKDNKRIEAISNIVLDNLKNIHYPEKEKEITTVKILKTHCSSKDRFPNNDHTRSLVSIYFCMALIPTPRIHNILVDISVQPNLYKPNLYKVLVNEQRKVIKEHGYKITMASLMEMKILDSFIQESLALSSPASYMHREVKSDVVLSNGDFIKKGSLLSVCSFSKYHNPKKSEYSLRQFELSKHLQPKIDKNANDDSDLIWGYGERACPFKKYAFAQMKIFIAIFIRNYYIYPNYDGLELNHPGYQMVSTVLPASNKIYLKPRSL
ncbi:hypothetical protein BB561_006673 [Smittium simulii]|uniref:Cytochrome P450 n=1 Tax=Smittium simulii TaxID=133385 RepID=A0A2T9Y2F4_9FUNG|nr:hypothetical protein BB561_006673 [Smittium simulii]